MRLVILWAAFGLVLLAAASHASAEIVVFGPRAYTITAGKPVAVTEPVMIERVDSCAADVAFVLVAQNDRVSSGTVHVNGAAVIIERDLNPSRERIEVPLALQNANTMTVELKGGAPGASLTLSIRQIVEEPIASEAHYELSAGRTVFHHSSAVDDPGNGFVLYVRNGNEAGERRVAAASISLNGAPVVAQDEWDRTAPATLRVPVSLRAQNELVIDTRGASGSILSVMLRRILPDDFCRPEVTITEPDENSVVTTAVIPVRGTVTGSKDVAVTVNGVIAELDLTRAGTSDDPFLWFADVPAAEGEVTLTATAATLSGTTSNDGRTVILQRSPRAIELSATPRSGVAPLEVAFHVSSQQPTEVARYEIDFDGNGEYELSVGELPSVISHTYDTPAVHSIVVRTIMTDGTVETAGTNVLAHSWASMDGLLRPIWTRMVSALEIQGVDAALRNFSPSARRKYEPALRTIRPSLPAYVQSIAGFDPVWIQGNAAHYLLRRLQDGRTFGYHVYFTRGADGVWRLSQF